MKYFIRNEGFIIFFLKWYFCIINHKKQAPLFSEREGFRKYLHIGSFCIRFGLQGR